MNSKKAFTVLFALALAGAAIAGDVLEGGADGTKNKLEGPVVYARQMAFNGSTWDRVYAGLSNYPVLDAEAAGNCVAITASSVAKTLPTASNVFQLCAYGNNAYVLCGDNPTATTTVTTGYALIVPEGSCIGPMVITDAKCAVIGTSAAGSLCFLNYGKLY